VIRDVREDRPMALTELSEDEHDALRTLLDRICDAREGFDVMVRKAEADFRPIAEKFQALHKAHAAHVTEILVEHGHDPSEPGTFMGSVNEAVVSIRALFDEIDEDVMDSVRHGERSVLKAFDKALSEAPQGIRSDLTRMRAELQTLLDQTAHLD
jgi:hypothetical protein